MTHPLGALTEKIATIAYGADGTAEGGNVLRKMEFEREAPKGNELLIDILYCGICHSDAHLLDDNWKMTLYPCVPGHEIVGRVKLTGPEATKFKTGDIVGVGCMVDSCMTCSACQEGEENHCECSHGPTMTYNGYLYPNGSKYNTFGGYASNIVVREEFVLRIPEGMDMARAAPLLCPGVATYGPLKRFKIKAGDKVAIAGIGGPGHLAIQFATAMGAEVTAITTHADKREVALQLGAKNVILSTDAKAMKDHHRYFHHILSTIPNPFDVMPYLSLLRRKGSMTAMGLLGPYAEALNNFALAGQGLSLSGSMIGSITESQEVLDFAAQHNILPTIELVKMRDVNSAIERLKKADVRFRFVLDLSTI